ncbi:MAG: hypothetical protein C4306_05340 [Thermoleophilia bacterium]
MCRFDAGAATSLCRSSPAARFAGAREHGRVRAWLQGRLSEGEGSNPLRAVLYGFLRLITS